ncbi:ribosome assembly protein RRB1 [Kwoniella heveanensis CBS 569]|uniref:Glutamate-rich WD repeat-containing protein 1 n=1 Tax=Kwoniella heveanensis BCC8398 TaxID=1296120 RepID=A0A1B9GV13_9TREE|nr:ribosome assembly protein RRB1 [Kwoniella heveanensis BCC8398]OCF38812.1 ribosome assembly protein RRB1 [Kwoniella heveanensis CBS 569]
MAKRTSEAADMPPPKSAAKGQETARPQAAVQVDEEMGEFEDRWEDEYESEGEVVDAGAEDDEEGDDDFTPAQEDSAPAPEPTKTYLPGTAMEADEHLVPDNSVYLALHSLSYAWPCLSFDVLKDDLGSDRATFPHTSWIVTGTQAGEVPGQGKAKDEVVIMRLGNLAKTQHDDDESDEEEDDDDEGNDEDATLDFLTIPHVGSVNRIRAAPGNGTAPGIPDPYHVATFSETGKVHIFDVRPYIDTLGGPSSKPRQKLPVHTITSHGRAEGFAVEWGPTGLLTGDIDRKIFLTTVTPTGFTTSAQPYLSHTSSVEDLQWSPSEPTVFASASADKTVRVWDVRAKGRKSVVSVQAHDEDVNVISWNKGVEYLLVSGGDEGGLKVWDLRMFKGTPTPVAHFQWHTEPITSVEWNPADSSVFAASGSDDQLTLWDLSVEPDEDEAPIVTSAEGAPNVPPQLLFVHQGQKDTKEVHWHPQIPGMVLSTASDGFNVFKTISC